MKKIKTLFAALSIFLFIGIVTATPHTDSKKANDIENVVGSISTSLILASTVVAFKFHKNFKGNKGHSNRELDIVSNGFDFTQKASMNPDSPNYGGIGNGGGSGKDAKDSSGTEAELLEKIKSQIATTLNEKFENLMEASQTTGKLKGIIEQINNATTKSDFDKLVGKLDALGLELAAAKESQKGQRAPQTFADRIMSGVKEKWTEITNLKSAKSGMVGIEIKAETMTEGTSVIPIGSGIPFALTQWEPGLARVARRNPFILQLVNVARTTMEYCAWAEQTNTLPGAAANTAEGALKTQGSFRWTENKSQIETITYFIKASKRILDDISIIESEIRTELMEVLALRVDQQILNGTGISPEIKGLLPYAQSFGSTSALIHNVAAPTALDVLMAAMDAVRTNGTNVGGEIQGIFEPNYIVMHPTDVTAMRLAKDSQGRYMMPPFIGADYKDVTSVPIIQNVGMKQGSYLVGDFTKYNARIREDANIAIGYENDDFTKNLVTILGECRIGGYVKNNYVKAFISDTFAEGINALRYPS